MKELVVFHINHNEQINNIFFTIDKSGLVAKTYTLKNLSENKSKFKNHTFVTLVPSVDITFLSVTLKNLTKENFIKAAPFELAEELLDNSSNLHFTITDPNPNGEAIALVTKKEKMNTWLNLIKQLNISIDYFLPDLYAIDIGILQSPDITWCRQNNLTGFACYNSTYENLKKLTDMNIQENNSNDNIEQFFYHINLSETPINLLHSDFSYAASNQKLSKNKIKNLILCCLTPIILLLVSKMLDIYNLNTQIDIIDNKVNTLAHYINPDLKNKISGKELIQDKLNSLPKHHKGGNFLTLLKDISIAKAKVPVDILNINFDSKKNELKIELTATDFNTLENYLKALQNQAISVNQKTALERDGKVRSELFIKG